MAERPPHAAPAPPAPRRPLVRSAEHRVLFGVCGGLGEALGVDPVLVRLAFAVAAVAGGIGIAVYLAAVLLLPGPPPGAPHRPYRHRAQEALGLGMLLFVGAAVLSQSGILLPLDVLGPGVLLLGGLALIWRQASPDSAPSVPELAAQAGMPDSRDVARTLLGLMLVGGGALLFLRLGADATAFVSAAIAASIAAAGIGLLVGPRLRRARVEAEAERGERIRTEERALVAARLHDSVLQTLALIQRTSDARRAQLLARRQERELRAWLYGGEEAGAPQTFAAALRHAADEVEADYGVGIRLVQPRDAALDADLEALVAAAREAMTNAAKHAGVDEVSVLARVTDGEASVFVRDRGRGFQRALVAPDRRGLRESIEARMARHGGRATIDARPGEGTEIELTLPRKTP
ncbi:PspC domain-containing protein [Conexibacter arvalis]|uniref:Signal transduction histidine kinase/phage shock protein PspC (Stress-responsive transcriptional regulator) n=1 Tax=Conexibacter arvalis TaxID=912552 RepID=A0A840I9J1_9ACTN|nr:signal transduction histidine kinase/phage shock protein PspC (stress-responsive transcriptional regulator) [Conexibacter arvalis]